MKFYLSIPLLLILFATLSAKPDRPNIVFIFSDDHTQQSIGAYGEHLAYLDPTPNIDRLADEGIRFDRFYVENSICAPSRATLLTGKFSHKHGKLTNGGGFNHDQMTFPKLLQTVGYQTALFGKIHLRGTPQGFDAWEVLPGQGSYYNPEFITADGNRVYEGYVADIITDKSVEWLENERDADKPFLLMVHHKGTHRTWCPALRHIRLYEDEDIAIPDTLWYNSENRGAAAQKQNMTIAETMNFQNDLKVKTLEYISRFDSEHVGNDFLPRGERGAYFRMNPEQRAAWDEVYGPKNRAFLAAELEGKELVEWKYQRYIKDYLRTAKSIDESVGRILDWLIEHDLDSNTIVIYSSDQGFYLGENGWFDKRFMYEPSFRAPLLARWPNHIKEGSVNADLTQNIDFAPTFLELAGVKIPSDMQGDSLKPLLKGLEAEDWRESLYYHYYEYPGAHSVRKHEGVATKYHKLIRFYGQDVPDSEEWEFYDLSKDPNELINQYNNSTYSDQIKDLKSELDKLRTQYEVPETDS